MNLKKTLAAGTLAAALTIAPAASAAQSAEAATWFPTKPSTSQPVGWGSNCAYVRTWWGGTKVYRWLTTSVGGSTCTYHHTAIWR